MFRIMSPEDDLVPEDFTMRMSPEELAAMLASAKAVENQMLAANTYETDEDQYDDYNYSSEASDEADEDDVDEIIADEPPIAQVQDDAWGQGLLAFFQAAPLADEEDQQQAAVALPQPIIRKFCR